MSNKNNNPKIDNSKYERYIISCMLNDTNVLENAITKLTYSDFSNLTYKYIFLAISNIYKVGKQINVSLLIENIKSNENLSNNIKNFNEIINIVNSEYTSSADADVYIDYVKEQSIISQINNFGKKLVDFKPELMNFNENIFNALTEFTNIINSKKIDQIHPISEIINSYRNQLANLINKDTSKISGLDTGFKGINNLTDGFQKGDLIILAARPGVGKTALALNFILNSAKSILNTKNFNQIKKKPLIVLFSIEMSAKQVIQRMIANESTVDLKKIQRGNLSPIEYDSLSMTLSLLAKLPIIIDDSSDLSIIDIQSKLKQLSANYDIKLVVVDYLQLLKGNTGNKFANINRQQEVSNISRLLKIIARQNNTPILALAQLSRAIEQRAKASTDENPHPLLSDLRESGAIEQDADIVSFLYYRYKKDNLDNNEVNPLNAEEIEYIIEKHRNGATGKVVLNFIKNYGKFTEYDKKEIK